MRATHHGKVSSVILLPAIYRSAWKARAANFACIGFSEIRPRCRICLRMGGATFAVSVGFLLDALVGHGEVGLPGHAVVAGYLPGRLHDVRAAEPCGGAL